jgi:hypothetical protein
VDTLFWTDLIKYCSKTVLTMNPDVGFLALAAGFEGGLLALAIPLSFSIVSNISEKFESDIITERFLQHPVNRYFTPLLVVSIIISFVLSFSDDSVRNCVLWKLGAWLSGILFLIICVVFVRFISIVGRYITDVQNIIEELLDDAEKAIEK